jgi:hypothetical protein
MVSGCGIMCMGFSCPAGSGAESASSGFNGMVMLQRRRIVLVLMLELQERDQLGADLKNVVTR